jgi:hypothetical protein
LEAPGIGKISFRLDNDCAREKIKGLGGRWCCVINQPLKRVGAELTGLSAFIRSTSSAIRFQYALDQLPPLAFTAYGLQSII